MTREDDGRRDVLPGAGRSGAAPATHHTERLGAHRPRRSPLLDLLPLLVVVLVVAAVGVGVWQLTTATPSTVTSSGGPADPGDDPGDDPGTAPGTSPSASGSAPASATAAASATATGSATGTRSPLPTPAPAATPTGVVDRSLPVTVLNATGRSGLAGRTATALRAQGWTALTANSTERPAATVVYYPDEDDAASALAVGTELAAGAVVAAQPPTELSERFGTDRITVVIGADATG